MEDDLVKVLQGQKRSARTIRLAVTVLAAACKWGMRRGRLVRNPCEGVALPTGERKEMKALDADQVRAFRKAAAGSEHAALFDFLLFTGARPGEALALRWRDLDLEAGVAHIRQALSRYKRESDGEEKRSAKAGKMAPRKVSTYEFREPKAGSGRAIPLPPTLVAALRGHRKAQAARVLELGESYWRKLDLIFANELGEPLDERNLVQRHFKKFLKAAGLPKEVRLYDLRHTHASNLLAAGEPVKAVSERLGHASAKMTLDVYAHVLPGQGERLAGVVESLFA